MAQTASEKHKAATATIREALLRTVKQEVFPSTLLLFPNGLRLSWITLISYTFLKDLVESILILSTLQMGKHLRNSCGQYSLVKLVTIFVLLCSNINTKPF